jgi:hypothetical protein
LKQPLKQFLQHTVSVQHNFAKHGYATNVKMLTSGR